MQASQELWPELPLKDWQKTCDTLHLWMQIVGKVRRACAPAQNHWWHITFYLNARGLTTGPMPLANNIFEIQFDFVAHSLEILTNRGERISRSLRDESVAEFYRAVMAALQSLTIDVSIDTHPDEIANAIPYDQDTYNATYDAAYVERWWRILQSSARVFEQFRAKYAGKQSPVHMFWGSFDLAYARFSGHRQQTDKVLVDQEFSAGFWPGGGTINGPAYYAYTLPRPTQLEKQIVAPTAASWNPKLGEFILMYDDIRQSASPEKHLMEFLTSTYEAGARLADWNRTELEIQA